MVNAIKEGGVLVLIYLVPLLCYSVLSIAVMLERTLTLRRLRRVEEQEFPRIRDGLANGKRQETIGRLELSPAPVAPVVLAGLEYRRHGPEQVKEAVGAALALQSAHFSRYLGVLATVGSTAPFIGLFGTVLGILRAFNKIAAQGFGGPSVVAGGIAEALVATALGLGIAIPAVVAYNVFVGKVNELTLTVNSHASALVPLIVEREAADARA
ncbi:MAG: MotA/TolQ/ExbB proton channel family protein [Armatimonadetes bacterium]|nr:MotA/TolQ/ExbB proton channel family protein [Armatimonadota bacterium]